MKKILLATSALVALGGAAYADVSVSGSGYMGVIYNDAEFEGGDETRFKSRIRIQFDASGETDGGLTFGGSIRADNAGGTGDNAAGGNAGQEGNVYIAGSMWKLAMGDLDGAMEQAVGDLAGVGYEGIGDLNETIYLGSAYDETALLTVNAGAATLYASAGQFGVSDEINVDVLGYDVLLDANVEDVYSVGGSFDAGMFSIGAGYETATVGGTDIDGYGVSGSADLGVATVKAQYINHDLPGGDFEQTGVSVSAPVGMVSVSAYYKQFAVGSDDVDTYGVGVAYDLGGGAMFKAGVAQADYGTDDITTADAGVTFSF